VTRTGFRPLVTGGSLAAATFALALTSPRPARADRYEATLAIRPTRASARIWEDGTAESVKVQGRGFAASASDRL